MYKKPMEYLESICEVLSIEKNTITKEWPNYIEAKSRRDLGVHNGWVCNSTYLRKVHEAKIETEAKEGDSMLPTYDGYVKELLTSLSNIVFSITKQIEIKHA